MTATTVTITTANDKAAYRQYERRKRAIADTTSNPDYLAIPFDTGNFTPPSTSTDEANDEYQVYYFPKGFKLVDLQIVSTARVDSGGTAWVYDLNADNGSTEVTLISGCTIGITASGKDEMDRNGGNMLLDVGGYYLSLKTTTPATTNAGTGVLRIKGWGFMGDLAVANVR